MRKGLHTPTPTQKLTKPTDHPPHTRARAHPHTLKHKLTSHLPIQTKIRLTHTYTRINTHKQARTHIHPHTGIHTHRHACSCRHIDTHTHSHTYIHQTHKHTHTHTISSNSRCLCYHQLSQKQNYLRTKCQCDGVNILFLLPGSK